MGTLSAEQIKVFLGVVEHGSFSAAARVLSRKQSAVSYAILNLEAQLGITLFDRTGSRPVLTAAGAALLPDARKMAHSLDTLRARAGGLSLGVEAELDIVVDAYCPLDAIMPVFQAFAAAFPLVKPTVHLELGAPAVERMLSGKSSLGLISHPMATHEELEQFYTDIMIEVVPFAAAGHRLAQSSQRITSDELAEYVQLAVPRPIALGVGDSFSVLSGKVWTCDDVRMQQEMLLAGIGWGFMPTGAVAADVRAGRLVRLDLAAWPRGGSSQLPIMVVRLVNASMGPAANWLLARFSQTGQT